MSFFGTWAVYIDTIFERGPGGWPFWRKPSRYLPTMTSACELGRYSVTIAAMRFAVAASGAAAVARNSLRVVIGIHRTTTSRTFVQRDLPPGPSIYKLTMYSPAFS